MKSFLFYILCVLSFLHLSLPGFAQAEGEQVGFKAKYKKVALDEIAVRALGIETAKVEEKVIDDVVKTTGQIEEIPNNRFDVNCPVQGKVVSILVDLGSKIYVGQPLAIVQSTEIARLQAEINQFKAELELAKSNFEREKALLERKVSAKRDFEAARTVLASTEAKLIAAQSNFKILTGQEAASPDGTFNIRAGKAGTIVERNITIGQIVNPNQILFRGIDLSSVWASADIYERDRTKVTLNQNVQIILDALPDKTFEGKITYIGSVITKETRTLPVKAILHNTLDNYLQPGAFIQLIVHTEQKKKSIIIPLTALAEIDKTIGTGKHKHMVYILKNKMFEPREVEVEPHDSNNVEVISGLMPGETIVTKGAYQLQYAENKGEEKHKKQNFPFSIEALYATPLRMFFIILIALLIGFFIGKKK